MWLQSGFGTSVAYSLICDVKSMWGQSNVAKGLLTEPPKLRVKISLYPFEWFVLGALSRQLIGGKLAPPQLWGWVLRYSTHDKTIGTLTGHLQWSCLQQVGNNLNAQQWKTGRKSRISLNEMTGLSLRLREQGTQRGAVKAGPELLLKHSQF